MLAVPSPPQLRSLPPPSPRPFPKQAGGRRAPATRGGRPISLCLAQGLGCRKRQVVFPTPPLPKTCGFFLFPLLSLNQAILYSNKARGAQRLCCSTHLRCRGPGNSPGQMGGSLHRALGSLGGHGGAEQPPRPPTGPGTTLSACQARRAEDFWGETREKGAPGSTALRNWGKRAPERTGGAARLRPGAAAGKGAGAAAP